MSKPARELTSDRKVIAFRPPKSVVNKLEEIAKNNNRSVSFVLNALVEKALEDIDSGKIVIKQVFITTDDETSGA